MVTAGRYIFLIYCITLVYCCQGGPSADASAQPQALNNRLISGAKAGIHTGDIIFRSGKDFTSYRIRELSDKNKTYSHAGIALVRDTDVFVYHITPPELNEPASDTAMRLEKLEQFAATKKCFGFGVLRYQLSSAEIDKAMHYLDSLYRAKVSFDHRFNLEDDNKMYCSEMVDKTLQYASNGRIMLARKYFSRTQALKAAAYFHRDINEVKRSQYISIDNIQLHPGAMVIHDYVFLQ